MLPRPDLKASIFQIQYLFVCVSFQAKQPHRKEELQEAFTMHCSPNNTISANKLGVVIRSIGRAPTEAQLRTLCNEFENRGQFLKLIVGKKQQANKKHSENADTSTL